MEPSRVPRSDSGQKMILWAFYRQGSNFEALVRPLRAGARAGDRPGHTILIKYLCPTEPGSAATSPVLRCLAPKNHYTAEFKLQATTRPFCLPRPFRPYPGPRTGRGTQLNSTRTTPAEEKRQNPSVFANRARTKPLHDCPESMNFAPGHSRRLRSRPSRMPAAREAPASR